MTVGLMFSSLALAGTCPPGDQGIVRVVFDAQHPMQETTLYKDELLLVRFPPPADAFWLDRLRSGPELEALRDDDLKAAIVAHKRNPATEKAPVGFYGRTPADTAIDFLPFVPPNLVLDAALPEKLSLTVHVQSSARPATPPAVSAPIPVPQRPGFWQRLFSKTPPQEIPGNEADCRRP